MKIRIDRYISTKIMLFSILLFLTCISLLCAEGVGNGSTISLRYHSPLSQSQAVQARRHAVKTKSVFFPTLWSQSEVVCKNSFSSAQAVMLRIFGESGIVMSSPVLSGVYPAPEQSGVCAVSGGLAWALWGSMEVIGLELETADAIYTVCGVFEENEQVLAIGANEAETLLTWQAVELNGEAAENRKATAQEFAVSSGLGQPDTIIDNSVLIWWLRLLAIFPLLLTAMHGLYRGLRVILLMLVPKWRRVIIFTTLLILVLLLPALLEQLPGELLPTRWSDFDFWGRLLQTAYEDFKQYIMRYPLFTDEKVKLLTMLQAIIGFIQAIVVLFLFFRKGVTDSQ